MTAEDVQLHISNSKADAIYNGIEFSEREATEANWV